MPQKVSQFPAAGALASTDIAPVVQNTSSTGTRRTTLQAISDWIVGSAASFTPAGANAVTSTVQTKLREKVSVFDFMTAAQIADVTANTGALDVGTAITAALVYVAVLSSGFPSGKTLYFPAGTYSYATCPNFAIVNGLNIIGDPGTVFNHTGTGNALLIDAGAVTGFINELVIQNVRVQGNGSSTNAVYMRGIGRSIFKNLWVTGAALTGSALRIDFGLLNTFENFQVNSCAAGKIPKYGIYLDKRGAGEQTTTQIFINPIIEGLTTSGGAGIYIDNGNANVFIGGASETNDTGIWITANSAGYNTFYGVDSEGNAVRQLYVLGPKNVFAPVLCSIAGAVLISGASATDNTFLGGRLGALTLDGTSLKNAFIGVEIATSLTDTAALSTFIDCTVAASPKINRIQTSTFLGAVTGTTAAFTKATAGDVISFTNGGATPKTGYLYSDANFAGMFSGAGATGGGFLIDVANSQMHFYSATSLEQLRLLHTASATRFVTVTGSNGGNSEIDVSAGLLSIGSVSVTINVKTGGSTTISTGVGSVRMSTANAATNTAWIPLAYAGTTYFVPAWTTNAP